ncbi:uncharacterized protein LOC118179071 [Oxyura jamaicensis]|uniref:uncharacterized protein LOC118179071 n=1 Tax=Oxyura jamaicensis TaxID=8884 RepID=UPI0015A54D15|nr:uncharacterized protein LOC118179071 [Oxyura jamaicensis]
MLPVCLEVTPSLWLLKLFAPRSAAGFPKAAGPPLPLKPGLASPSKLLETHPGASHSPTLLHRHLPPLPFPETPRSTHPTNPQPPHAHEHPDPIPGSPRAAPRARASPAPRPAGTAAAPPCAHAGQEAHFSYRNRVFKNTNCLRGDRRRDLEQRIASFTATTLGPGWLQHLPCDFWFTFGLRNELRQSSFVGFVSRPVLPSTHTIAPSLHPVFISVTKEVAKPKTQQQNPSWEAASEHGEGKSHGPGCKILCVRRGKLPSELEREKTNPNRITTETKTKQAQRKDRQLYKKTRLFCFVPINNLP